MSNGILSAGFNPTEVEPTNNFEAIPAGEYRAVITESEEKQTRAGTGSYLQLTFVVTDGEYANRRVWARLNLNNPNPQAVQIAQRELSSICRAAGITKEIHDASPLHDIPMLVKVIAKPDDGGELRNEIKGYKPVGGGTAAKATSSSKPTAAGSSSAPWAKK